MNKKVFQEFFSQKLPANNLRYEKCFLNQLLKMILTVSFLIVLLFPITIAEGDSNGNVIHVNTTGWEKDGIFHPSSTPIQSAIHNATAGDTIIVEPGIYHEHIVIDKPLTLLGAQANVDPTVEGVRTDPSNESIIIGTGGGYDGAAIVIELSEATDEPEVIINGFTIKNPEGDYGIILPTSPDTPPYKDAIIEYNIITECGFGIESWYGLAAGSVVRKNSIINNTRGIECYPSYTTVALVIEENKFVDNEVGIYMGYTEDFSIIGNNFTGNEYGIYIYYDDGSEVHYNNIEGNTEYGIYSEGLPAINTTLNYWGDSTGPYHATTNPCATGDNVSDYVVYTPWLNAPYPGGQAKSFNVFIDSNKNGQYDAGESTFNCIQSAINSASDGDTIIVHDGVYDEQIIVNKILTIQGQGDTTVIKPSQATANNFQLFSRKASGSANTAAIIVVNANATIKNLKIDGSEITSVPSGATLVGILYRGVNGTIEAVTVDGISIANGNAIYISSMGKKSNVEVKGCRISNFYKNGITANYEGLTVNIRDNNIIGSGPIANVAQNGIQIGFGAAGSVAGNTVLEIAYIGEDYEACGILFLDSSGIATDNTVTNCQAGIVAQAGWYPPVTSNVTIENNRINATGLIGLSYVAGTGAVTWDENAVINITIKNNTLTGAGYGEGVSIGSEWAAGTVNATIEGNNISNWGHGIWIGPPSNQIVITGNNIINNVEVDSGIHITGVDVSNIKINFNNIQGNAAYGVYNGGDGTLNAEYNYWGDVDPTDDVSGNVDYSPWLGAEVGTSPMTWYTNDNLQDVIDEANPGDTIIIHEGIYNEKLTIDKSLTIEGVDKEKVILDGTGLSEKGISVEADNVVIKNLTVRNFVQGNWSWGVELVGASHCIIEDLIVYNCSSGGINLYKGCHNNIVRNNLIKNCDGNGISIYGSSEGCLYNLIENNTIIDCAFAETDGTYRVPAICVFSGASYNTIRGNIIRQVNEIGKGRGITLWGITYDGADMPETGNIIEYNLIENFDIGIYVIGVNPYTGSKNLVTNTTVRYNNLTKNDVGFQQIGFEEDYSPITLYFNNIFDNHDYGALVDTSYGAATLNATLNYWGHPSGPNATDNPNGLGDRVSDNVTYRPYYIDAAMTVLSTESQIMLNETTQVNETKTEIIIPPNNPSANITVPSNVTNATLNLAPILSKTNETAYATLAGSLNVNTSTPIGNVLIQIPSNVTISGNVSWNGTINLPRFKGTTPSVPLSSLPVSPGYTPTVTSVIEIGFGDVELVFDKAVRILIPGKAGQKVGYSRGGTFTEISDICPHPADQARVDAWFVAYPDKKDCKIDYGSDLVVWTKHFTEFVTYTESPAPAPTPARAGGGGGVARYLRIDIISADTAITQTANTSQTYEVEVRNLGTVTANITLTISDLPSTYYTISLPSITLESRETGVLSYTLNLPADAKSTTFKVTLDAVSGGLTDSKTYEVELTVIPPTVITQEVNVTVPRNVTKNVTVPVVPGIGVPVATITGRFTAIISQPSTQLAIGLVISVIVLVVMIRMIMERRKPWRTRYGLSYQERLTMNLKRQIKKVIGG